MKVKNRKYLGNGVSDFCKVFDPKCIRSHLAISPKIVFPAIFGGYLEFLRKIQKRIYRKQCEIE